MSTIPIKDKDSYFLPSLLCSTSASTPPHHHPSSTLVFILHISRQMDRHWPLLSFFGSVVGFYLLLIRNPDIKIGAQEQTWAGCEVGVGWTGRNKCLVKRKYIPYLDNSRFECIIIARENCFGIPSTQSLKLINIFPNLPSPPLILNSWAGWKADVGQRGSSKHMVKEGEYNTTLDKSQLTSSSNVSDSVESLQDGESGFRSENALMAANTNQIEAEWIEQYEPGVYITLVNCEDGTRDIKRVRFSRKIFQEHQAETWWSENRLKVYEMYDIRSTNKSSGQAAGRAEGAASPVSRALIAANTNQLETEWIEQYEPGVYVTIVNFKDGTRDLKRVRFSRRRFQEHQAETWWSENREKVYKKFDVHITYTASEQAAERGRGRCFTCFPSSREIDSE
ncbi:hypothetical protein L6164_003176 [Bauhinia variegata]|uniref:Uncharacterized protein n=1 Tax=Bauhinia variegata TaxID=167791 RepID=A0ACB9Q2U8_BAUVA|nr:hypothetical protein L6164_003176 [Bauhinia variegata]